MIFLWKNLGNLSLNFLNKAYSINPSKQPITFKIISSTSNTLPIKNWITSIDKEVIKPNKRTIETLSTLIYPAIMTP